MIYYAIAFIIGIIIMIIVITLLLRCRDSKNLVKVKSNLDGKRYFVQDYADKQQAANMLAEIQRRITTLRNYLSVHRNSYPEFIPYIDQFLRNSGHLELLENSPGKKHTSYTINKGQAMILCLRSADNYQLHAINLVMYVVIHELSHVACPEVNHTPLFKKIFVFLLKISEKLGLYQYTAYNLHPEEYCGIIIDENLLR